jgi:hypothetical protein
MDNPFFYGKIYNGNIYMGFINPIKMIGYGILGVGKGVLVGGAIGFSILFVNERIGDIVSGVPGSVEGRPLNADYTSAIMLTSIGGGGIAGGIHGLILGAQ